MGSGGLGLTWAELDGGAVPLTWADMTQSDALDVGGPSFNPKIVGSNPTGGTRRDKGLGGDQGPKGVCVPWHIPWDTGRWASTSRGSVRGHAGQ